MKRAVADAEVAVMKAERAFADMPMHKKAMAGAEFGALVGAIRAVHVEILAIYDEVATGGK